MAENKNLKTLTLPNAQGELVKYDLAPKWEKIEGKPEELNELRGAAIGRKGTAEGAEIFNNYDNNVASGINSHAEGDGAKAIGLNSHAEGKGAEAHGADSHAEGRYAKAYGEGSHAEGNNAEAHELFSHAEGYRTRARGVYSHAEGDCAEANGRQSHAEGASTKALGSASHAEGNKTEANQYASHAEGSYSKATGGSAHAEGGHYKVFDETGAYTEMGGGGTLASGNSSHAEGASTIASGNFSHASGHGTIASGRASYAAGEGIIESVGSGRGDELGYLTFTSGPTKTLNAGDHLMFVHVAEAGKSRERNLVLIDASGTYVLDDGLEDGITYEIYRLIYNEASGKGARSIGTGTTASGEFSIAEGYKTTAQGNYSHAEGLHSKATVEGAHAEGYQTEATGKYAHSEGRTAKAQGYCSHAEGFGTTVSKDYGHAEGNTTKASARSAHAEGEQTTASATYTHAEGYYTKATSTCAHSEGSQTTAGGDYAHAEGYSTTTSNRAAHAEGESTTASGIASHAEGYYATASGKYSHAENNQSKATGESSHAEGAKGEDIEPVLFDWGYYEFTIYNGQYCIELSGINRESDDAGVVSADFPPIDTNLLLRGEIPIVLTSIIYHDTWGTGNNYYSYYYPTDDTASGAYAEGTIYEPQGGATNDGSYAGGKGSHAEGISTYTLTAAAHVEGKYNIKDFSNKYLHITGIGTPENRANGFTVDTQGKGSFASTVATNGADYAEHFEWLDGNPDNEDRIGYMVTLDGDKIKLANEEDDVIGVISGTAAILGDNAEWEWKQKYLTDDFGRIIYEHVPICEYTFDEKLQATIATKIGETEELRPKLNPAYDPEQPYIARVDRPEWGVVGMFGKLYVRDDGTSLPNQYLKVGSGGIGVNSSSKTNMRVLRRVSENIVQILFT